MLYWCKELIQSIQYITNAQSHILEKLFGDAKLVPRVYLFISYSLKEFYGFYFFISLSIIVLVCLKSSPSTLFFKFLFSHLLWNLELFDFLKHNQERWVIKTTDENKNAVAVHVGNSWLLHIISLLHPHIDLDWLTC